MNLCGLSSTAGVIDFPSTLAAARVDTLDRLPVALVSHATTLVLPIAGDTCEAASIAWPPDITVTGETSSTLFSATLATTGACSAYKIDLVGQLSAEGGAGNQRRRVGMSHG